MCLAGPQLPKLSLSAYHMSCELGIELYFVFKGSFSTIKNNKFPSADTVGLSSANEVLMLGPTFSIFMIVEAVMTFSFCALSLEVSTAGGWAARMWVTKYSTDRRVGFCTT